MRRFLVTLAVLATLVGVSTPATAQDIAAMSFEQLTIANAEKNLAAATVNTGGKAAARCVGVLETASVRIRVDGTAASATVGTLVPVGAFVDIRGVDNVRRFSAFRTGGTSGVLPLTCFPSPAETTAAPYLNLTPTPAVSASALQPDGTAALPGIAFASDTDTGLYRIGANNLGVSTGGTLAFDWDTARALSALPIFLASGSAAAPGLAFGSDASNDSGLYLIGANNIGVALGGAIEANWTATAFSPGANAGSALGTTALGWNGLQLGTATAINWANGNATLTHATGKLTASVPIWNGTGGATTAGSIYFAEGTDNGTNTVQLIGAANTADVVVTLPATTGTVALTADKLSAFAATTSAEFAGVISNETGTGLVVLDTAPSFASTVRVGAAATYDGIIVSPAVKGGAQFDLTLSSADITEARAINFPNLSGTLAVAGGVQNGSTFDATGFLVAGTAGIDKTCGGPVISATFTKGLVTAMTCTSDPGPAPVPTVAELAARIQYLESVIAQLLTDRERR